MEGKIEQNTADTPFSQLRGWMKKQGEGKLKGWKKRYFIQEASKLYYFYSDSNANDLSAALGFIDLSLASDIFVVNESCFDLVTPGRYTTYKHLNETLSSITFCSFRVNSQFVEYHVQEGDFPSFPYVHLISCPNSPVVEVYHFQALKEREKGMEDKDALQYWITGISVLINIHKKSSKMTHQEQLEKGLVPLKGWLKKQGEGTFRGWKKRYFKQEGSKLFYFASENEKDAIGYIDIALISSISTISDVQFDLLMMSSEAGMKGHVLSGQKEVMRIQLQTENEKELQHWTASLQSWISYLRPFTNSSQADDTETLHITKEHIDENEDLETEILNFTDTADEEKKFSKKFLQSNSRVPKLIVNQPIQRSSNSEKTPIITFQGSIYDVLPFVLIVGLLLLLMVLLPLPFIFGVFTGLALFTAAFIALFRFVLLKSHTAPRASSYNSSNPHSHHSPYDLGLTEDLPEAEPEALAETYLWIINNIFAKVFREHTNNENFKEKYKQRLNLRISEAKKPGFLRDLYISDINFGNNAFEIVHGVKLLESSSPGELKMALYLRYRGDSPACVTVHASVALTNLASVPLTLQVTMEEISGPLEFVMPEGEDPLCIIHFTSEPNSKWSVGSGVGNTTNLKNVPKLSPFFVNKLQQFLKRELVYPNGVCFHIPIKNERQLKVRLLRKFRNTMNNNGNVGEGKNAVDAASTGAASSSATYWRATLNLTKRAFGWRESRDHEPNNNNNNSNHQNNAVQS